ncbi:MAG: 2-hydroxyisocaproyl-CoA dehydratase activator [Firmicutes bacterium]|nr:2-hydroxyisocaproyl-CoA dehydratase activator [Bacillota bacterium]
MDEKHVVGICLGSSNIKIVTGEVRDGGFLLLRQASHPHGGNARKVLQELLGEYVLPHSRIALTGHKLKEQVLLPVISEPEATELALLHLQSQLPKVDAVVSAGGENFIVYALDSLGRIATVHVGNKCASGTGEFFLQQIRRMSLSPAEAGEQADIDAPYKIADRCSVFSKSDCTHALNKGTKKGRVVAGLGRMMAGKITELLQKANAKDVLLVGGVTKNSTVISFLRRDGFNVTIPASADSFEALGAALWAKEHGQGLRGTQLFKEDASSFEFLPPLSQAESRVTFKEQLWGEVTLADEYIIGLDAGSTTTKAVLMRTRDRAIVAGKYLRTDGDPVRASRQCYLSLAEQVPPGLAIVGLGVTGSGRQIVGLHGLTRGIINEIIAHTTAAAHFDPAVDTLFEIGGQDAKYTYIVNSVPADYAMNEACSAGTGSFLEEAAKETLGIATEEIAHSALKGDRPPNFNDQCAAFIGSDIKTAIQEGISSENIAAGLVYAICLNYVTRVKGSRKVGQKIFMQGGVCYNKAVPLAMALITDRDIVVPPDPGLMGAFGVALEYCHKIEAGLLPPGKFDLVELATREVEYGAVFECAGGKDSCDRKCSIARIKVDGRIYPFGGACNKYYNERLHEKHDTASFNLVALRQKLLYDRPLVPPEPRGRTVGISQSLMTNSLYPFYHAFLADLGFSIVLSDGLDGEGIERRNAPFCYPLDMAHGFMMNLLRKRPDYILMPHVRATPVTGGAKPSTTCPLIQGEPYVLRRIFKSELQGIKLLTPVLNMPSTYEEGEKNMLRLGGLLGVSQGEARRAFRAAVRAQNDFLDKLKEIGRQALLRSAETQVPVVVLFGRSYNAFLDLANMGVPHKFASRGVMVLPHEMLDCDAEPPIGTMHWAAGMSILKAAKVVKEQPHLFGCYITNFSCGPDSFILNYFREIMQDKPSLTLELDSHTADAGIDTRIDAFLDIIKRFGSIRGSVSAGESLCVPAEMIKEGTSWVFRSSDGERLRLTDSRVKVLIPTMGDFSTRLLASMFSHFGITAIPLPPPSEADLARGKNYTTCKECLPLILTIGSLHNYLDQRPSGEKTVYFMPTTSGSCRFAQYNVLTKMLIQKQQISDLALMSLSSKDSYGGMGNMFTLRALWATHIGDVMEEVRAAVLTLARDRQAALVTYREAEDILLRAIATMGWRDLVKALKDVARLLSGIPLHTPLSQASKVALVGEIYVRRDGLSQRYLVERLAEKGIVVLMAPVVEWVYYTNYLASKGLRGPVTAMQPLKSWGKAQVMEHYERVIKGIFVASNLYDYHLIDIRRLVESVAHIINPELTGEAILTLACALNDIVDRVDGVISIGPFGCMPARIAESLIKQCIDAEKQFMGSDSELVKKIVAEHPHLPFISIESDGSPFPPVIEARLESFVLQVKRMQNTRAKHGV